MAEPATWRSFVALELSDEVRKNVARLQERLRQTGAHIACPDPKHAHLTLVFLGDMFPDTLAKLMPALDAAAIQVSGFKFQVSGAGFFGPPRSPRVIWAGVETQPALEHLYQGVTEAARSLEIPIDERSFRPHVTLARIRSQKRVGELTSLLPLIKSVRLGEVPVTRVVLLRSHLEQPQARYSLLHESLLKGT